MLRVLLSCGDMAFCEFLRGFFEAEKDFSVRRVTTNDVHAIRTAIKCSPDLIVLGMARPAKSGSESGCPQDCSPANSSILDDPLYGWVRRKGRRCPQAWMPCLIKGRIFLRS
jgi:hypothetical protein